MFSVISCIRSRKNKEGKNAVFIRITKSRKSSYLNTGLFVLDKFWDNKKRVIKKGAPNSVRMNALLKKKLHDISQVILDFELKGKDVSVTQLLDKVNGVRNSLSFTNLSDNHLNILRKEGKFNRVSAEKSRLKRVIEFNGNKDITLSDINVSFLKSYRAWLKSVKNIGERTIVNHLIDIRTIYNQAINSNLIERGMYPFGKGKIVLKFPPSDKLGLSQAEVEKIERLDLSHSNALENTRNVWLFSLYLAGMRVSDVLTLVWDDIDDGRLNYRMNKNSKIGSLKLPSKANAILKKYEVSKSDSIYIFPYLNSSSRIKDKWGIQKKISYCNHALNKNLKEIAKLIKMKKNLTMHIARHTFGNLSGDKLPIQLLQKLYRHSNVSTTIGYQSNFVSKEEDEGLDKVIGF